MRFRRLKRPIYSHEIECRSFLFTEEQQEVFDIIRSDLARVFQEAYKNDMMQPVNARSRITALLEDLSRYFAAGERVKHSRSGRERIQMASDYILQHYKEAVTLEDFAELPAVFWCFVSGIHNAGTSGACNS